MGAEAQGAGGASRTAEAAEPRRVVVPPGVANGIRQHAAEAYPNECCGALFGNDAMITQMLRLPNVTNEGPRRRFLVLPADYRAAEAHASETGAELAGFYHSHPDHPARPSRYDLDHAWPFFIYLIVSVPNGAPRDMTSWRLRDDRSAFVADALIVEEPWPTRS
jgi:proteasome lid subunit RPN8/RPN11